MQKHIFSLCLSLAEVLKFSYESNKNRSKNVASIQANIKLVKKKNQKQWDNLIGTFTGKITLKWDWSGLIMFVFDLFFQGEPLIEVWEL